MVLESEQITEFKTQPTDLLPTDVPFVGRQKTPLPHHEKEVVKTASLTLSQYNETTRSAILRFQLQHGRKPTRIELLSDLGLDSAFLTSVDQSIQTITEVMVPKIDGYLSNLSVTEEMIDPLERVITEKYRELLAQFTVSERIQSFPFPNSNTLRMYIISQHKKLTSDKQQGKAEITKIAIHTSAREVDEEDLEDRFLLKEVLGNSDYFEQTDELTTENSFLPRTPVENIRKEKSVNADLDDVQLYLQEAGRRRLLTAEEEITLAQAIERGAKVIKNRAVPIGEETSKQSDVDLQILASAQEARKILTESNLRLVVSVARKYQGRGLDFLDLIQEGNLGLMRAVEKFDWHRGFRFSTYAYWWIRQGVARSIADQSRTSRIPVHMYEQISAVYAATIDLQQELEADPTAEQIGQKLEMPAEKVREILRISLRQVSLETPMGDENDTELGDMISSRDSGPEELTIQKVLEESLFEKMSETLTEREQRVLELRFGINENEQYTLEEIGQELGVSRERVRQIEAEALVKLRKPIVRQALQTFLDKS